MKEYTEYCLILGTGYTVSIDGVKKEIIEPEYAASLGFLTPDEEESVVENAVIAIHQFNRRNGDKLSDIPVFLDRNESTEQRYGLFIKRRNDFSTRLEMKCEKLFLMSDEFNNKCMVDGKRPGEKAFLKYFLLLFIKGYADSLLFERSGCFGGVLQVAEEPRENEFPFTDFFPDGWESELKMVMEEMEVCDERVTFLGHCDRAWDLIDYIKERYERFILPDGVPCRGPFIHRLSHLEQVFN